MSAAAAHITAMREWLGMPPREAALWMRLNRHERAALLVMCGLPQAWSSRRWDSFLQIERTKLLDQVNAAAKWQQYLHGPGA